MQEFDLSKPLKMPDGELMKLEYDFDSLTAKDKMEASKIMSQMGLSFITAEELDPNYHVCLFALAACKANTDLEIADVFRMGARDSKKAGSLARSFFYLDSEK